MNTEVLSGLKAAKVLGVKYRTLMQWVEDGLIEVNGGKQHGVSTQWGKKNLREASVIQALRAKRVPLQKIREIMTYLREKLGHNPLSTGDFVVVGNVDGHPRDVIKIINKQEAISLLGTPGQLVFPLWAEEKPMMEG